MNFPLFQRDSRSSTLLLSVYFGLSVLLTFLLVYFVALVLFAAVRYLLFAAHGASPSEALLPSLYVGELFCLTAVLYCLLLAVGILNTFNQFSHNPARVLERLGGVPLGMTGANLETRRFSNVAEELAIAAGIPLPNLYTFPAQPGINALAFGIDPADAFIAVTAGALRFLNREELQAVVAHEFSHLTSRDTRLNMWLLGFIQGMLILYLAGKWALEDFGGQSPELEADAVSLNYSRSLREPTHAPALIVIFSPVLFLVGGIGLLFTRLMQRAVSRERELLADATAVEYCRLPQGLARALVKIGGHSHGSVVYGSGFEGLRHFFIAESRPPSWFQLFSTHPALSERILRLDPSFDGVFPEIGPVTREEPVERLRCAADSQAGEQESVPAPQEPDVGTLLLNDPLAYAQQFLAGVPEEVRDIMAHGVLRPVVALGLLGAQEPLTSLPPTAQEFLRKLDQLGRFALLLILLPQLRTDGSAKLAQSVRAFLEGLERQEIFPYALGRYLLAQLEAPPKYSGPVSRSLEGNLPHVRDLLLCLSYLGNAREDAAEAAFMRGYAVVVPGTRVKPQAAERASLVILEGAILNLRRTAPEIRALIVRACREAVLADRTVRANELALLRTVAALLEVPSS